MVRLLAYGGTGYVERHRIGNWPSIPAGTLQDLYGLASGKMAYGVGILENQPFLVIRERQNANCRGGYPYSLLLDPGERIWQSYGWNAAWLLSVILKDPAISKLLLQEPERCSSQALEEALGSMRPIPSPMTLADRNQNIEALWTGALLHAEQVVVNPEPFIEGPLTPDALAAMLHELPPCFRCGWGWLAGASSIHGKYLGARLILNAEGSWPLQSVEKLKLQGQTILEGLMLQESNPEYRDTTRMLAIIPIWKWPSDAVPLQAMESLGSLRAKPAGITAKTAANSITGAESRHRGYQIIQ